MNLSSVFPRRKFPLKDIPNGLLPLNCTPALQQASLSLAPPLPSFILLFFFLPASFSPSLKIPSEKLNNETQNVPLEMWPRCDWLPLSPSRVLPPR